MNLLPRRERHSTKPYSNIVESTVAAACGLYFAIRREKKIRQVFLAMLVFTLICILADVGYFQILMIIFSWVVALICEIFNTALEKALDYASGKEFHPLIRQGKDYAAACTFVAIIFAVFLALFVLRDRYFSDEHPRTRIHHNDQAATE